MNKMRRVGKNNNQPVAEDATVGVADDSVAAATPSPEIETQDQAPEVEAAEAAEATVVPGDPVAVGQEAPDESGTLAETEEEQPPDVVPEEETGGPVDSVEETEETEDTEYVEGDSLLYRESGVEAEASQGDLEDEETVEVVRESDEAQPQTAPLQHVPEREDLTPLPVNAVVDGRYVVQSQLHHSPDRNLYRVTTRRQQRCASCGRPSSADLDTCPQCGAALDGQTPADFYLMAESYRPDALIQDAGMMDLHLYHPNLVPVIDFFNYKPFGKTRYFAVAEPRQGVRLSQMSLPRPGAQVLGWAMQLADALDYLHNRGVVGAGAESDDILVQGDRASLASLQNARTTVTDGAEQLQQQTMDLARLAATIYEAYTGNAATISPEGMLPMPPGAPEQVGAAFRAAIEPVQGVAPPISVEHWRNMLAQALEAVAELERPGRPVNIVSAGLTDVGRLREQNQDSFGMAEFVQASAERPMKLGLYIVADGLGGHKGGEIASALAVQSFTGELVGRIISPLMAMTSDRSAPSNEAILQGMTRAVQSANERIYKARNSRQNDMGTTLVAAVIAGGKAYIANVGDSRLYMYTRTRDPREAGATEGPAIDATRPLVKGTSPLAGTLYLRRGQVTETPTAGGEEAPDGEDFALTQVSIDHSLVHRLVELGQLDPEEAKVHPHRNFIYRSLGGPPPIEVDTFVRTLHPGDRLLICSDGLNSMVEDSDIEEVLANEDDPQIACQRLIDLANEAGGHDNITTIIIDVTDYLPLPEHPYALDNA
ncbi:MAG TPA: protein phosphatase 2C domain-containing protein [Chloroflexia bacterium]|jgi:protein phosphatase